MTGAVGVHAGRDYGSGDANETMKRDDTESQTEERERQKQKPNEPVSLPPCPTRLPNREIHC